MSLMYKDEEFAEKIWHEFCKDTEGEWDQLHQPHPKDMVKWLIIKEYLKRSPEPVCR